MNIYYICGFLVFLTALLLASLIFIICNKKDLKKPKSDGVIIVNVSNPEEEYFTCKVNEDFFKHVNGYSPKEYVIFDIQFRW